MGGLTLRYRVDDGELRERISGLRGKARDLRPAMRQFGEYMKLETRERFDRGRDPDGRPWKRLKPASLLGSRRQFAKKKRGKDGSLSKGYAKYMAREERYVQNRRVLWRKGHLYRSINYRADFGSFSMASGLEYAAIHQLGGKTKPHTIKPRRRKVLAFGGTFAKEVKHPGSDIPARRFLGYGERNVAELRRLVVEHLRSSEGEGA